MTVRTWITLSVLILVALSVAIVVRLLAPVEAPPILVRSGDVRLDGSLVESCWPQRGGDLRCEEGGRFATEVRTIRPEGELRVIVAYPAQPEDGSIEIVRDGGGKKTYDWDDEVSYDLEPGTYSITARAEYPLDAHVVYRFGFSIR